MAAADRPSTARSGRTKSPKALGTENDKEQSARFIETARKLEADESGELFERAVAKVLPAKPK